MNTERQSHLERLHECIDRAAVFVDDVMPQIGGIVIQDYANLHKLTVLLKELKSNAMERSKDD